MFNRLTTSTLVAFGVLVVSASFGAASAFAETSPSEFGFASTSASLSTRQAGAHPDVTTDFTLKTDPSSPIDRAGFHRPLAPTSNISISLPPGLVGNPDAVVACTELQFATSFEGGGCPLDSQVGITKFHNYNTAVSFTEPVFNLENPPGAGTVARLAFYGYSVPIFINVRLRPESEYGLTATIEGINSSFELITAETVLWGVPADPSHDKQRLTVEETEGTPGLNISPARPSGLAPTPFMTNPTRCDVPLEVGYGVESFEFGSLRSEASTPLGSIYGCNQLAFDPSIAFSATAAEADSPTGLNVELGLPQPGLANTNDLGTASLKKAVVTLPEGFTLNPAAASGLGACSEEEVGLISSSPVRFDASPSGCPESSRVGTAEIDTPVLAKPIDGALYIATQSQNPFGSPLAGYLVAEGQGATIKLAGRFALDPNTGQITATFDNNPQVPFDRLQLHFDGGSRGVLVAPSACGSYMVSSALSSWASADLEEPSLAETVRSTSQLAVESGPGGSSCPSDNFAPKLVAGTSSPAAGGYSPFLLQLSREDGTQRLQSVAVTLPKGLIGKLAGIPLCPQSALAGISAAEGTGAAELANPSCPAASEVGTASVSAGAGSSPFVVNTGKVYLAGPYKGAPFSLAIVTPALAGPFDLGSVVVRTRLQIDPTTAQVTAVSDPLPTILDGIPLDLRDVSVSLSKPGFTLNPTSCEPTQISSTVVATTGASATVSSPFQAANCATLKFAPKFTVSTSGKTSKLNGASLKVKLTFPGTPQGTEANIARAKVDLPKQLPSRLTTLQQACSAAQFASSPAGCPAASAVGIVVAHTPVLNVPLTGPAYFVSYGNEAFPRLVFVLQGEGVTVDVVADTFISKAGITSSTFAQVPDVPISSLELTLPQGKYSALAANGNLCRTRLAMPTEFVAQNGAVIHESTPIDVEGCPNSISVVSHVLKGRDLMLSVSVPAAGKLTATGKGLSKASKTSKGRETIKLTLHTASGGGLSTKVNLTFTPSKGRKQSAALGVKLSK